MPIKPKLLTQEQIIERIAQIKERRAKATQTVTQIMWVVDGGESGDSSGWMPTNKILDGSDHEFTEDTYESLEKQIAEFGGESNYDNDHEFCFHAYSDVLFLLEMLADSETRNRERDEALVQAGFDSGATEMARFGAGLPDNPEPQFEKIIALVDKAEAEKAKEVRNE